MTPESELQPWALRQFERSYERQDRREKCSRVDFYAGYRAALIEFEVWSAFTVRPLEAASGHR